MTVRPTFPRAALLAAGAVIAGGHGAQAANDIADAEIAADGSTLVSSVTVEGRSPNLLDHGTGLSILPTTVQDTPQAINVIPAEQLRAQGVTTLEQALRNVPGITIAIGEGGTLNGDQFKIRGFDAKDDVYLDGLRDFGVYTRDSFDTQEVQVLKGPSGAMFGRGTTGGAINTVSKTPFLKDETVVIAGVGNGEFYRAVADFNTVLGETTALRVNLMGTSSGVVDRDMIYSHRWGAAVALGFGLGTGTSFTLSYLHQEDDRRPDYGITIVQRPGDLIALPATEYDVGVSRSTYLGYAADHDRTRANVVTARFSHAVSPALTLTSDSRIGFYSRYFQYTTVDQCLTACTAALFDNDPATVPLGGAGGGGPYDQEAWGAQTIAAVRWDASAGRLRNQLIAGFDLSYQRNDKTFYAYSLPAGIAARNLIPQPLIGKDPAFPPGYGVIYPTPALVATGRTSATAATVLLSDGKSTDYAVFATDRLWLSEAWSVIAGVRYDRYAADLRTTAVSGLATPVRSTSNLINPKASLVYEPTGGQTYYVSYGRAATPQGTSIVGAGTAIALTAKDLEPEISETFELGAKIGLFGGRLGLTGSAFDIRKDNALQSDPGTGFLIAQSGERQEVRGVELGAMGKITRNWSINANYTYLDARIEESFSNCVLPPATLPATAPTTIVCPIGATAVIPVLNPVAVGQQVAFVPKHSASIWTDYELDDWVRGLSVGGGVTYQGRLNLGYTAVSASYADRGRLVAAKLPQTPETISLDAVVTYRFGRYRLAVNGYNLTDRLNYTQVFGNRAIPSPGRTVVLSVGAEF